MSNFVLINLKMFVYDKWCFDIFLGAKNHSEAHSNLHVNFLVCIIAENELQLKIRKFTFGTFAV